MTEDEAIHCLKQGDIRGLEPLVRRYQTEAIRAAFLITRDAARAEDIVQNAFLRVFERIDQFDARRPFAPWFFRIVTNMALKAVRCSRLPLSLERHRDDFDPLQELLPDDTGPERRLSNQEFRKRVWIALGKLTPKQRAVIVFRYYLEMGEAEIAEELDVPTGTVKSRLYAARERLRQLLSPV